MHSHPSWSKKKSLPILLTNHQVKSCLFKTDWSKGGGQNWTKGNYCRGKDRRRHVHVFLTTWWGWPGVLFWSGKAADCWEGRWQICDGGGTRRTSQLSAHAEMKVKTLKGPLERSWEGSPASNVNPALLSPARL